MSDTLLVIAAESSQIHELKNILIHKLHYGVSHVLQASEGLEWLRTAPAPADAVLMDLELPDMTWQEALPAIHALRPQLPVILCARYGGPEHAIAMVQNGAYDVLRMPVTYERLNIAVQNALRMHRLRHYTSWLERKVAGHVDFSDAVGQSPDFLRALEQAKQLAKSDAPFIIQGEDGVGKEWLARAVHAAGVRAGRPFIAVNCQLLQGRIGESALFGSAEATESAAVLGHLHEAAQGTLLLKYADSLPMELQRRLADTGGLGPRMIAVMRENAPSLHPDLGARFNAEPIRLTPLRKRRGDILRLAEHFLIIHSAAENKYIKGFTSRAREWLMAQAWPGNARQLTDAVWRAVILCGDGIIDIEDLNPQVSRGDRKPEQHGARLLDAQGNVRTLRSVEEEAIRFALKHSGGCMTRAARDLGIGRSTLYRKLGELDLSS